MKSFVIGLFAALPLAAFAHAHLDKSVPANNATVPASPPNVVLVFSEAVGLEAVTLQKDGDKAATPLGPLPKDEGVALQVALPKLAKGRYTIRYHAISSDQHDSKGTLVFTVAGP